jgi:hypothetical protein
MNVVDLNNSRILWYIEAAYFRVVNDFEEIDKVIRD